MAGAAAARGGTEPGLQAHCFLFCCRRLWLKPKATERLNHRMHTQATGQALAYTNEYSHVKYSLERITKFFLVDIWHIGRKDVKPIHFVFVEVLKKLIIAIRFFVTKRMVTQAAALTYSTLLAIVPILAVVFAIGRGFGYNKYLEMWFRDAFQSQPQAAEVIIGFVNSYLVHTKSGIFLGVGLIFMLYTVLMLVNNIETTFNEIWHVKKARNIYRTFTDYLAMLLLFPILIVVTSGLSIFMATVFDHLPDLALIGPIKRFFIALVPYTLMSAMFIGLYVFMPNTHVKVRNVIVPGILAGVAMQWLQLFYINSQIWVSSYNAIYGSFAALPLFMLWVQISWTICLFGAELCYANQNLDYYDNNAKTSDVSYRYRMLLCTIIMSIICKRFDNGSRPYTANELRAETSIPIRIVNDLLYDLVNAKLLIEITTDEKGEQTRFMPSENVERLSVGKMIDNLEAVGKWKLDIDREAYNGELWTKAMKLRSDYLNGMRKILLKDM